MTDITLLAHAGHDHSYVIGGEWHHYLWLAAAVGVAVAGLVSYVVVKKSRG